MKPNINVIKSSPPVCYCGAPTRLMSSKEYYGKSYGGDRFVCVNFPDCRGSVGTHPNGEPLGSVPTPATKAKRMKLHALIDPLWRNLPSKKAQKRKRAAVYGYFSDITGIPRDDFHMGEFDEQLCDHVLDMLNQAPYVAMSEYSVTDLVSPEPGSQTEAVKSAKDTPTTPIIEEDV